MTVSPYSAAISGLTAATNRMNLIASSITSAYSNPPDMPPAQDYDTDLARDSTEMDLAKFDFEANLMVVKAADKMTGSLLDLFG